MTTTVVQRLNLARFFRGEGPQPGSISLNRRRIYILPTRAGLIFGLLQFAMLLGAINYNNSLAYALTFLLTSLAVVSILHTYRNLQGLIFDVGQPRAVFAGEQIHIAVSVTHRERYARYAIKLGWPRQVPLVTDLQPFETRWLTLTTTALHRGRQAIGRITVYTRYPLGLFHAWGFVHFDTHCLVYPQPGPPRKLPFDAVHFAGEEGDRGRGSDDYAGQRPYHRGDSLRQVNWKAMARERGLLTKQFAGDRAREILLHWDRLDRLDTEARLSQLCRWVLEAEQAGLRYGLAIPGQQIAPGQGNAHRQRCLTALALFGNTST